MALPDSITERARQGAQVRREVLGADHYWTLRTARELSIALRFAAAPDDALELAQEVFGRCTRLFGEAHPDTLAARYRSFVAHYHQVPALLAERRDEHRKLADVDFLPGALAMAVAFVRRLQPG